MDGLGKLFSDVELSLEIEGTRFGRAADDCWWASRLFTDREVSFDELDESLSEDAFRWCFAHVGGTLVDAEGIGENAPGRL